jgi:type VI secretion system ImpA family protein
MNQGVWKTERKVANWALVEELVSSALKDKSKDLSLAIMLTEAAVRNRGFAGLHEGADLIRELLAHFWDRGLLPLLQDDTLEDRSVPLEWLNERLPDILREIPLTIRNDRAKDYAYVDFIEARRVGSEKSYLRENGDIDDARRKKYQADIAAGRISMEMYEAAVKATGRTAYEPYFTTFDEACGAVTRLEQAVLEKFGKAAPSFHLLRESLGEIRTEIEKILKKVRDQEPGPIPTQPISETQKGQSAPVVFRFNLGSSTSADATPAAGSWQEAEQLITAGHIEKGLGLMARLAATETSGRARFQRKLLLAQICIGTGKERLARTILEELAEQIDKLQLESWETPELVGAVWTRLYKIYKSSPNSGDGDRAAKLYDRLSRLDPWQTLACAED